MIHEAFNKSEIALRYYTLKRPYRIYTKQEAIKQLNQDTKVDRKLLRSVFEGVYKEQKEMLKH
jgi:hypothetical protein